MLPYKLFILPVLQLFAIDIARAQFSEPSKPWILREREHGVRCVVIQMSAYFAITYNQTMDGDSKMNVAELPLESDASIATGMPDEQHPCVPDSNNELLVNLMFGVKFNHRLQITFQKSSEIYYVESLLFEYEINGEQFPGHSVESGTLLNATHEELELKTPQGNSFECKELQTFEMTTDGLDQVVFYVKNLQFEAFSNREDSHFSKPTLCDLDEKERNMLPMIIGISIGFVFMTLLVVFIFIRYFKRSRNRTRFEALKLLDR